MAKVTHFYTTADFPLEDISSLVGHALALKQGKGKESLAGKIMTLLFFNPSLRTRLSFTAAMEKLKGKAVDFPLSAGYPIEFAEGVVMDAGKIEHVKDAAHVISRYSDVLGIRASDLVTTSPESPHVPSWDELKKDTVIQSFMQYTAVPVINMESNVYHPCQGVADAVTIKETFGKTKGKKYVLSWVPHPKALPMATPNSQLISACELGMDVTVAYPVGWELDQTIVTIAQKRAQEAGGSLSISNNQIDALKGAHIVCAKSWGALLGKKKREKIPDWIVNKEKMSLTHDGYIMHCLPVRRNVEVTDEVLDSPNSLIYTQAENRMWAQMAILLYLL